MLKTATVLSQTGLFREIYHGSGLYLLLLAAFTLVYVWHYRDEVAARWDFLWQLLLLGGGILLLYYGVFAWIAWISELRHANELGGITPERRQEYYIQFQIIVLRRAALLISAIAVAGFSRYRVKLRRKDVS